MQKPTIVTLRVRQERLWDEFRDQFLEEYIEKYAGDTTDDIDEKTMKSFRANANTAFEKFVFKKRNDFIDECKAKGEIWSKDAYPFNKGWIVNDEKMKKTLERYPKLLDVIHFIDAEGKHVDTIDPEDWKSYTVKTGLGTETRKYSHVIVNKAFYRRAEETIGIKKPTMQKYLQAFCDRGILKQAGRLKSHDRAMLYVDGYYHQMPVGGRIRKVRFLNKDDHQKALRKFKY